MKISSLNKLVRRVQASQYLLLMLISFALSVSLTRAFLELTGYPQLGNSELHIAHVLWGGLLLFVGSLLPLIFANRKIYWLSALVTGIGVGLFIDEVGKFITQTNDYFYPLAAPIIYGFFLLSVLVYLSTRRSKPDSARSALYHALELTMEAVDGDMDAAELLALKQRLLKLVQDENETVHRQLAQNLLSFLETLGVVEPNLGILYQLKQQWQHFSQRWLLAGRLKLALMLGLSFLTLQSIIQFVIISVLLYQLNSSSENIVWRWDLIVPPGDIMGMRWFLVMVILNAAVGLILAYSVLLLLRNQGIKGSRWAILGLVLALTTVSLLLFYYNQFASMTSNLLYLLMLVLANLYQQKLLQEE